jgi:hypothetical protein
MGIAPVVLVPIFVWFFSGWLLENPSKNILNTVPYVFFFLALNVIPIGFYKSAWHVLAAVLSVGLLCVPVFIASAIVFHRLSKCFRLID